MFIHCLLSAMLMKGAWVKAPPKKIMLPHKFEQSGLLEICPHMKCYYIER